MAAGKKLTQERQECLDTLMVLVDGIAQDCAVKKPYNRFFEDTASYILNAGDLMRLALAGKIQTMPEFEAKIWNQTMYEDYAGSAYESSWLNPAFAARHMSLPYARFLSTLAREMKVLTGFAYEGAFDRFYDTVNFFLQMYRVFVEDEVPTRSTLKNLLAAYIDQVLADYVEEYTAGRIDPDGSFAKEILLQAEAEGAFAENDLSYLYRLGAYIGPDTEALSTYVNRLPSKEIDRLAQAWVDGYHVGFLLAGKPFEKKKSVRLVYQLGVERIVVAAIHKFKALGLDCVLQRDSASMLVRSEHPGGFYSESPSEQCDFDHRQDAAVFLDERFIEMKLKKLEQSLSDRSAQAAVYGGPAVIELFGTAPFSPVVKPEAVTYDEKQQELMVTWMSRSRELIHRYVLPEERSFTIISFPTPGIGPDFEEIFRETAKINTLDVAKYERIQQTLIDALDQGIAVHILGRGDNETDLTVALQKLSDPDTQTLFENCLADVNIPVGEVFTTPQLKGTNGCLHVTSVYLEGLRYDDLWLEFEDGMVRGYGCENFDTVSENRKYLQDNLLCHHETLPLGEFAIGTNTTAYRMMMQYGIEDRMDILIKEKTGPHFAIGDTCYSCEEELSTYNPNGKQIVAKENDCSRLRDSDISRAYFQVHTDITIPYSELDAIEVLCADGSHIPLIENGMFVLPGTEELNRPLADM